ncbi:uncharacterized protein PG998_014952 [Apiospora kogelbergensis]|uniref:uncharacterized protein n=1 Tax=Apiospora kogelbergensis TaxID=1337665 RepID=UPI003130C543
MYLPNLLFGWLVPAILAQRFFIDDLPGYKSLPPCAEQPIKIIVKYMSSGCGDHKKTTSYSCFCSASSMRFASLIGKDVSKLCLPETATAVSQAQDLFASYCAMGSAANGTAALTNTGSASVTTAANATPESPSASPTASAGVAPTRPTLPASPSETKSAVAKSKSYDRTLAAVLLSLGMVGVL